MCKRCLRSIHQWERGISLLLSVTSCSLTRTSCDPKEGKVNDLTCGVCYIAEENIIPEGRGG